MIFISNQFNLASKCNTNITPEILKLLRQREVSRFLRFSDVTFQNLGIFWTTYNLNDAIRRFCDVTNLSNPFYDSVSKSKLVNSI